MAMVTGNDTLAPWSSDATTWKLPSAPVSPGVKRKLPSDARLTVPPAACGDGARLAVTRPCACEMPASTPGAATSRWAPR
jgi:hypothetical protein